MEDFLRSFTATFPELEAPLRQLLGIGVPRRIFVCSPLRGDYEANVTKAKTYCKFVITRGHVPYAPHLFFTQLLDDAKPEQREAGILMGLFELNRCDELWAFLPDGGPTEGMQQEIAHAQKRGIPVRELKVGG